MDMGYLKPTKLFYHPERVAAYIRNLEVQPITVKLYLTERCNLSCRYCVYKDRLTSAEMDYEKYLEILRNLNQMGVKAIVLTGGEPTMYPVYESATRQARMHGFDVGVITNGVLARSIENLTWIRFSVDTPSSKTYARIKGMPDLPAVISSIESAINEKKAKNLKTTIGVQMVVTEDNCREILEFADFFSRMEINYCQIRPVENAKYTAEQMVIIKEQIGIINKKKFKVPVTTTRYKWEEVENNYKKSYDGCPGAKFIGAVGVTGDFYICCTWMKSLKAKYGNVSDHRILKKRDPVLKKFDYSKCPVGCQGSLINKALIDFQNVEHRNFI